MKLRADEAPRNPGAALEYLSDARAPAIHALVGGGSPLFLSLLGEGLGFTKLAHRDPQGESTLSLIV